MRKKDYVVRHIGSNPQRKNIIEVDIRNISKIISDRIRLHEDIYWAAFFANIKMDGKTYRKIKGLCGLQNKIEFTRPRYRSNRPYRL